MFGINIVREGAIMDGAYYYDTITVPMGAADQLLDILAALEALGRNKAIGPARYVAIETDVSIMVKFNDTSLAEVPVLSTAARIIPANAMAISRLYFSHTGASSALGDATVTILAM